MKLLPNQTPPAAAKKPQSFEQIGRRRTDEYAWLKDQNWQAVMRDTSLLDLKIREHLEAENAFTASVLEHFPRRSFCA